MVSERITYIIERKVATKKGGKDAGKGINGKRRRIME